MPKLQESLENLSNKQLAIIFIVLGFVLYGNTLSHHYALDDAIVLTENEFTKQGFKGIPDILKHDSFTGFFGKEKKLVEGGRYRPFSLISFAIEYQLWGQKPSISHFINILIYTLITILIFQLVKSLLSEKLGLKYAHLLALFSSFLFIIHPIHTEVVANIKGRDELLSLLFSLGAFYSTLIYIKKQKAALLTSSLVLFFLGLMSKENTITFIVIIPLAIAYFRSCNIKNIIISTIPILIASAVFLLIRHNVLGGFHNAGTSELLNNPFVAATLNQKYATILYTWLIYFKLLIFPHPLTFDYYPYHILLVNFSNVWVIISIITTLALALIAFSGIQKKTIFSFSIISFFATFSIVSNLIFPVGTFMNERFIFMPSLFWCIAIAYIFIKLYNGNIKILKPIILGIVLTITVFYSVKTIARNTVWKNDLTLFTTDVITSHNSAKSNCSAGGKLWEEAKSETNTAKQQEYYSLSEKYLVKAIEIHPNYTDAWLLLGNLLYDYKKDIKKSADCYIEVIKRQPTNENAWNNASIVIHNSDDKKLQLSLYKQLHAIDSNKYQINYALGVLYGRYFNKLNLAIYHLKKATKLNSNMVDALKDLGTAYGIKGNAKLSYEYSLKALALVKNDHQIYVNLGIAASKLGMQNEAQEYFIKAENLKQK